jgi:hypothetical protein
MITAEMSESANCIPRISRLAAAFVVGFCAWIGVITPTCAGNDSATANPAAKAGDLTGLSLQELYDLDIIQPNVLGGHTHPAGQTMFGYGYMHLKMSGLYQGAQEISPAQAFAEGYSTVHTEMDMNMQMFDGMYAPTDWLTLMAMLDGHAALQANDNDPFDGSGRAIQTRCQRHRRSRNHGVDHHLRGHPQELQSPRAECGHEFPNRFY